MVKFGLALEPTMPVDQCIRLASLAEQVGLDSIWVCDNSPSPPFGDPFVTLTAVALNTRMVSLGTSICNPYSRHPGLIASSTLALNQVSKGRAVVGIGAGSPALLSTLGIEAWVSPVLTIKQTVDVLRSLFDGHMVSFDGAAFRLKTLQLSKAPNRIPIYIGARGERILNLAGQVADGVLLTVPTRYLETVVSHVRFGVEKAGRHSDEVDITNSLVISLSDDEREARETVRTVCVDLVAWAPAHMIGLLGIKKEDQERVLKGLEEGDAEQAAEYVTDRMVDLFSAAGTPDQCLTKCSEQLARGVSQIIFCIPFGPNPVAAVETLGRVVVGKLRKLFS